MRRIERLEARACGEKKPASSWRLARLDRRYDNATMAEAAAKGRAGQGDPWAWSGVGRGDRGVGSGVGGHPLTSKAAEKPRAFSPGQGGRGGQGGSTAASGEM